MSEIATHGCPADTARLARSKRGVEESPDVTLCYGARLPHTTVVGPTGPFANDTKEFPHTTVVAHGLGSSQTAFPLMSQTTAELPCKRETIPIVCPPEK